MQRGRNPRWGCETSAGQPRVARSSQPWALLRNPFGIHEARKTKCERRSAEDKVRMTKWRGQRAGRWKATVPVRIVNDWNVMLGATILRRSHGQLGCRLLIF